MRTGVALLRPLWLVLPVGLLCSAAAPGLCRAQSADAAPPLRTEAWDTSEEAFARFAERIVRGGPRNLVARRKVRLHVQGDRGASHPRLLTDSRAGEAGGQGRCMISGTPTVLSYYLGEPKAVTQVGVFTFNWDARANQDFEVRFADGSGKPGEEPKWPREPHLTTGPTIVGNDRGGLHGYFAHEDGRPLVPEKVDWVQFRIWQTYGSKAGEPGKTKSKADSSTAVIELEVLGTRDDVLLPTREEIAHREAVEKAPKEPELVQKATWQETMLASREAIYRWEALQDRLAMFDFVVQFGPWHVLGPVSSNGQAAKSLRESKSIDVRKPVRDDEGKELRWTRREDLEDWQVVDLTPQAGAARDDTLFLCREVLVERPLDNRSRDFALSINADQGSAWILPEGRGFPTHGPFGEIRRADHWQSDAGRHELLVQLRPDRQGRLRLCVLPQPNAARPGAGDEGNRRNRRRSLFDQVREAFPAPQAQAEMRWEAADRIWFNPTGRDLEAFVPGCSEAFLRRRYASALRTRMGRVEEELASESGVKAEAIAPRRERLDAWLAERRPSGKSEEIDLDALRGAYHQTCMLEEAIAISGRIRSLRLAVEDQRETFAARYPKASEYLARVDALQQRTGSAWERLLSGRDAAFDAWSDLAADVEKAGSEILLANPLLDFDKLLLVRGGSRFASNWNGANSLGSQIVVLSPVRPDGEVTTIHSGRVSDMDLHWDAQRLLFSDGQAVWEIDVDGTDLRRVSAEDPPVTHYDACYLPDGRICCVSNACEQAVPCTGGANVGNLHIMDADGTNERRVAFDQDHNWNPTLLNDGRVLYTRWEYTDTPHYFSRLLFRMNPDGTGQMEYYGSNSYWPNAMYWPRPIPGHPTMVVCVVSGHHGVSRVGELVLLDPARGRHEADGAIQKIPGYGKPVEPVIKDQLVSDVWPRFAAPYPLAEPVTHAGAGKYFLACVQMDPWSTWDLYLVDVFDNMTPILKGGYMTPIPLVPRPEPPVIPSQVNADRDDATIYMADVYSGPGLEGYPRGSIKALRVGSHHYRFAGNGDTAASSLEGGWDVKKILGTVPVREDGSALFRVPANTPIFVQPLDAEGKAQQGMRSWYTAMPGEVASCVGCHERQNDAPPHRYAAAAVSRRPDEIEPWHGPVRGFSFDREVQPVLDRRCVGCHHGKTYTASDGRSTTIDFRAKRLHKDFDGPYSPAYVELQKYVRRAGYEADYHMPVPAEYEADTSHLVQLLKKGHYHVELSREDWERLYTWIDFNVPYPANWRESHRPPKDDQVERRVKYKALYAAIDDRDEEPLPLLPIAEFQAPKPIRQAPAELTLDQWPLEPEAARAMQQAAGPPEMELDLGDGVAMSLVLVPAGRFVMGAADQFPDERPQAVAAIDRPFYLGRMEVTNRQYAQFDATHDSAYAEGRWKDRSNRGTPINKPDQPVVRITWHRALAFCEWLSQKTGRRVTLPTEAQWEWACRAGTGTDFYVGDYAPGMKPFANIADEGQRRWNHGRAEPGYHDRVSFTGPGGRFEPNAWGLLDMHGNVAEWCLTTYRPFPYNPGDGRDDPRTLGPKVVRGGSWNDTLRFVTSASRWRYQPHQRAYTVGFRVVVEADDARAVAAGE